MNQTRISERLETAIRDPFLGDTTATLAEVALDAGIDEGVMREIPIIGTVVGLGRAVFSIRDRMFVNKLRYMLAEIDSVPVHVRQAMVEEINCSQDFTVKVGEKLLYIIDRCEDHDASTNIGRLFRAFLEGTIAYENFLRLAKAVDFLHTADLIEFVHAEWERVPAEEATKFLGTGLVELDPLHIWVEDQWDHKSSDKYIVEGANLTVSVTAVGKALRSILGPPRGTGTV